MASGPEIENWIAQRVLAFRTGGPPLTRLRDVQVPKLTSTTHGPASSEDFCVQQIAALFNEDEPSWLYLTLHGLDGEGWGTLDSTYLEQKLRALSELESVRIYPALDVLEHLQAPPALERGQDIGTQDTEM